MIAPVARCSGRATDVIRSAAAGPEHVLRPTEADTELRSCTTSRVQELLGLVHPSCKWSTSTSCKQQPVVNTQLVALIVTGMESDGALYMRPPS